jgi:glycosyltransferase involved in cell wall biosynthesis
MKNYPKISIVTPSFNQGKYIEQTILSILDQNYPNLEYIIIDGGSSDETVEIIKRYETRLTYWVSEKDNGQSDAINKGLKLCTGEIFNWINSDDFLEPNSLFLIAEEFQKKPFSALCGKVNVIDGSIFSHQRKSSYLKENRENSIANYNINQEGTWWNLNVIKELGGVNQGFKFTMDLDLWVRALLTFPFDSFNSIDEVFSNFRRHEDAKSTQNANVKLEDNNFIKETCHIFNQLLPIELKDESYFELLKIPKLEYSIHLNYKVQEAQKKIISEYYLYKLASQFYYSNDFQRSKKIIKALEKLKTEKFQKDIRYFKRKMFLLRFRINRI